MCQIACERPMQTPLPRPAIVATLGAAGLRVGELCALNWGDVDFAHARINVRDAKTPAGIRQVDMSPWLRDELTQLPAVTRQRGVGGASVPDTHPSRPSASERGRPQ